jgi:hypothetical protein
MPPSQASDIRAKSGENFALQVAHWVPVVNGKSRPHRKIGQVSGCARLAQRIGPKKTPRVDCAMSAELFLAQDRFSIAMRYIVNAYMFVRETTQPENEL